MRQRLIFAGLLEPVQRQHGLLSQLLLGLPIGFCWLHAAGQGHQRNADRRAEGHFLSHYSCHK
ncbi:hypothetical protein D3C71_1792690 [compost metagenome]